MDALTNNADGISNVDPTGTLTAATSAVKLVTAVVRLAPALKNASNGFKAQSSGSVPTLDSLKRQSSVPGLVPPAIQQVGAPRDPERERRAYETVNFVLREFGSCLCAAGLVDEHALNRALNTATQHIEVNLFSTEANRLFESLAPRLGDVTLVNSVFTSIYFIGLLAAQLSASLPNYKDTYVPVGQRLVQQLFWTAIGADAFRENLAANLDAYKTLSTTAGLLRPTDLESATFPGFPVFSPCRYSGRGLGETWSNKNLYEKLGKHFAKFGFPQPNQQAQTDVGVIREWRFLDGANWSRVVDVDKADKSIGEHFGLVLYWLICNAERSPAGQATIAYYDQHIALIKWIGLRMGYSLLTTADLNFIGAHGHIDPKARSIMNSWLIIMPSTKARTARQAASARWAAERQNAMQQMQKSTSATSPSASPATLSQHPYQAPGVSQPASPTSVGLTNTAQGTSSQSSREIATDPSKHDSAGQAKTPTIEHRINGINSWFNSHIKPQCFALLKSPPAHLPTRDLKRQHVIKQTEREVIYELDALHIPETHPGREHRKAIVQQAQKMISTLESLQSQAPQAVPAEMSNPSTSVGAGSSAVGIQAVRIPAELPASETTLPAQVTPVISPPPYSAGSSPSTISSSTSGFPFQEKRTPTIRRKAPPPPKKVIPAKALYDFDPEEDAEEELAFKEGDDIEIMERNTDLDAEGWCKARLKGSKKVGLVPLEYLEVQQVAPDIKSSAIAASSASPPNVGIDPKPSTTSAQGPQDSSPAPNHDNSLHRPGNSHTLSASAMSNEVKPTVAVHQQSPIDGKLSVEASQATHPNLQAAASPNVLEPLKPPVYSSQFAPNTFTPNLQSENPPGGQANSYYDSLQQFGPGPVAAQPSYDSNSHTGQSGLHGPGQVQTASHNGSPPLPIQQHHHAIDFQKKPTGWEKMGVAMGAVGAAAGIASVVQATTSFSTKDKSDQQANETQSPQSHGNFDNNQQSSPGSANATDQNRIDGTDATASGQNNNMPPSQQLVMQDADPGTIDSVIPANQSSGPASSDSTNTIAAAPDSSSVANDTATDGGIDLSTFGGGIDPAFQSDIIPNAQYQVASDGRSASPEFESSSFIDTSWTDAIDTGVMTPDATVSTTSALAGVDSGIDTSWNDAIDTSIPSATTMTDQGLLCSPFASMAIPAPSQTLITDTYGADTITTPTYADQTTTIAQNSFGDDDSTTIISQQDCSTWQTDDTDNATFDDF